MSMPYPMNVVVICKNPEIASIAAAILHGKYNSGTAPWIYAATTTRDLIKYEKFNVYKEFEIYIDIAIYFTLINARRVDYWLALDDQSAEDARMHVNNYRPLPNNFYHGPDTDTVLHCGFKIPGIPWGRESLFQWYETLAGNLKPWGKKFWDDFCQSS